MLDPVRVFLSLSLAELETFDSLSPFPSQVHSQSLPPSSISCSVLYLLEPNLFSSLFPAEAVLLPIPIPVPGFQQDIGEDRYPFLRNGIRGLSTLAGATNKGPFTEWPDSDFRAMLARKVVCCLVGVAGCGDGVVLEGEGSLFSGGGEGRGGTRKGIAIEGRRGWGWNEDAGEL